MADTSVFQQVLTLLQTIGNKLPGLGNNASADSQSITIASDDAQVGTDATGVSAPAGAAGLRGWLSGIFSRTDSLNAAFGAQTDASAGSDSGNYSAMAFLKRISAKLPGLGNHTSALSQSVTWASDDAQIGVGGTGIAQPTGGSGLMGWLSGIHKAITGKVTVIDQASTSASGTLGALNAQVILAVPQGSRSGVFYLASGTFNLTATAQYSLDGGATYINTIGKTTTSIGNASLTLVVTSALQPLIFEIPPGATHIAVTATAWTSGSTTAYLFAASVPVVAYTPISGSLSAGNSRVGFLARAAVWTRESTTPVNANLSITGAAKTTFNTTSGTALNTSTSYGDKFAAAAGADVAGTLIIEASPDAGTTYYPVASVALAQVGGAGNFGAYLETPICEATMRGRLLNGGTNQARAYLSTKLLG